MCIRDRSTSPFGRIVALSDNQSSTKWISKAEDIEGIENYTTADGTLTSGVLPYYDGTADSFFSDLRGAAGFDIFNVHDFYFGLQSMTTNQLTSAYSKNAHITTGKNVITDYFIEPGDYLKIDTCQYANRFH